MWAILRKEPAVSGGTALCLTVEGDEHWIDPPDGLIRALEDLEAPVVPRSECSRGEGGYPWRGRPRHAAYVMSLSPIRDGRVDVTWDDGTGEEGSRDTLGGSALYHCEIVEGDDGASVESCRAVLVSQAETPG